MTEDLTPRLAVLLHADVVGSTELVRQNEALTHQRIVHAFRQFSETISSHDGEPVTTQTRITLRPDDVVDLELPGGGGYGTPLEVSS